MTQTSGAVPDGAGPKAGGPSCSGSPDVPDSGDWSIDRQDISHEDALNPASN